MRDDGYRAAQARYDAAEPPEDCDVPCPDCDGIGRDSRTWRDGQPVGDVYVCRTCDGAGTVPDADREHAAEEAAAAYDAEADGAPWWI